MNWPRPVQVLPGHIVLPMISGIARVSGARGQTSGEPHPPLLPLRMISVVLNAAHSNYLIFNILLGFQLVTECNCSLQT